MKKRKNDQIFRLYANSPEPDNIEFAEQFRFNRITPGYLLVYTARELENVPEITDEDIDILSDADRRWLFECNMRLIAEEIARNGNKFGVDMQKAIVELEKALKHEKEIISGQQ